MADFHEQTSMYKKTPVEDFYLGYWVNIDIPPQDDDEIISISPEHDGRPDLYAHQKYGSSKYFWVFFMRNKDILFDPIDDFKTGIKIYVPSINTVKKFV